MVGLYHCAVVNELLLDDEGGGADDQVLVGVDDHSRVVGTVAVLHGSETPWKKPISLNQKSEVASHNTIFSS